MTVINVDENPEHRTAFVLLQLTPEERVRSYVGDFGGENGCYSNICSVCGQRFVGHKRRTVCALCGLLPQGKIAKEGEHT